MRNWLARRTCLVLCFFLLLLLSVEILARQYQPSFVTSKLSYFQTRQKGTVCSVFQQGRGRSKTWAAHSVSAHRAQSMTDDATRISERLVQSLDLEPVIRQLSNHAGTRRGREAILGLIGEENEARRPSVLELDTDIPASSRQRRVTRDSPTKTAQESHLSQNRHSLAPIASCAEEATREYELVEQARLAMDGSNGLVVPPLYGATSSPMDTETIAETDHDEWLDLSLSEEWTLEHVLQADQVVRTLLRVHEWGCLEETETWTPALSEIARTISKEKLQSVHQEIHGAVEIVTKRSVVGSQPMAYKFQLSQDRFPIFRLLREKEQILEDAIDQEMKAVLRKLKGSPESLEYEGRMVICVPKSQVTADLGIVRGTTDNERRCYVQPHSILLDGDELVSVRNELRSMQEEIQSGLITSIRGASTVIDRGIHTLARLDVAFSKAAYGNALNGDIPIVRHSGRIAIQDFVHPVLALCKGLSLEDPVPIDLYLSHDQGSQALIISGPNNGGKTIALKSFGVACLLAKLAIPVPRSKSSSNDTKPRVDFFDDVLVEVGDQQSVIEGESTLMAKLNAFSTVIESVTRDSDISSHTQESDPPCSSLVLLDELAGGTDPTAGGAIAQAIMEKLLESEDCRIVATTHSPRLKALSFNSTLYNCATVLLRRDPSSEFKLPSYKLEYGRIGDSYALGAASRCSPPLPEDVLTRAASLMASVPNADGQAEEANYLRALTLSLERENEAALNARKEWENESRDLQTCRNAMLNLAKSYSTHLERVENKLQGLLRELRDDESNSAFDVVGETLETLKLVKKKIKSEEELLKERGLKRVSPDHEFRDGDTVVVIAPGEHEGASATVLTTDKKRIIVIPSSPLWDDPFFSMDGTKEENAANEHKPLVLKRSEIAVWDMSSAWDEFEEEEAPVTSVRESRQRLNSLLTTLSSSAKTHQQDDSRAGRSAFKSARQRKAARAKKRKS